MCSRTCLALFATIVVWSTVAHAENLAKQVKKAVELCTLDQAGTKPFHLKATLAPSFERDKESGRTGEVEIWWISPTKWRREVRSPEFHQIEIVDGTSDWQKNEGDFLPEWLRETAVEIVNPVPPLEQVLEQVKTAEVRRMMGQININWTAVTGTTEVRNIVRSYIGLREGSEQLLFAGGLGWGGEFKDYTSFHGRMVAETVNVGSPQVTARVKTLEDLGQTPAGFFDAHAAGGDPQPIRTVLVDEISLRKNLLPMDPISWPPLQDGPLEGNVTTRVVVDREGKVREIGTVVSENSAVNDAGSRAAMALRFKPFLVNGIPAQVMSQVTLPFKTVRPTGTETFDTARTYFERGRHLSFPTPGTGSPYILHAEFDAKGISEAVDKGRYEDTWVSESRWRREAWFGKSHYVRSRNGEKGYQLSDGPDVVLLQLVLRILEPIPAIDTFVESDWRIKRDTVNGLRVVRVLAGYESPDGTLDAEQARGYWFDDTGLLLKTFFNGLETRRSVFEDFSGVRVARRIDVLRDEKLAIRIRITQVSPAETLPEKTFEIPKHEWTRAFTAEVR